MIFVLILHTGSMPEEIPKSVQEDYAVLAAVEY
jgi:hypothetical protein